ncbi:hypothetical protein HK096_007887 [Nowakowskiella sp. JEL0078]|nr:hypothetical protein HK096_007887 [Nowakowskiella sp. JEL0078]
MGKAITLQVSFQNQFQNIIFSELPSWAAFECEIRKAFTLPETLGLKTTYKETNGDIITLDTTEELNSLYVRTTGNLPSFLVTVAEQFSIPPYSSSSSYDPPPAISFSRGQGSVGISIPPPPVPPILVAVDVQSFRIAAKAAKKYARQCKAWSKDVKKLSKKYRKANKRYRDRDDSSSSSDSD